MSLNGCVHFITSCILGNDTDYFCLVEFVNRLACAGPVSVKLPTLQISHKTRILTIRATEELEYLYIKSRYYKIKILYTPLHEHLITISFKFSFNLPQKILYYTANCYEE